MSTSGRAGASAASGDVDGDGYGDVIVGAPGAGTCTPAGGLGGEVLVYLGGPDWAAAMPAIFGGAPLFGASGAAADVDADGYDDVLVGTPNVAAQVFFEQGAAQASFPPQPGSDCFGFVVAGLGDVNGDGIDDFAVGDPGGDPSGAFNDTGRIFVYFGGIPPAGAMSPITGPVPGGFSGTSVALRSAAPFEVVRRVPAWRVPFLWTAALIPTAW